jgi:hypothetical protein
MKKRDRLSEDYKKAGFEFHWIGDDGRHAYQYVPYRWKTEQEWNKDWWLILQGQKPKNNVPPFKKDKPS